MIDLYPNITKPEDIYEALIEIVRLRQEQDVPDWLNLSQIFVSGRSTNRIPSSASDVIATDNRGDITNDDTYEYKLVMISGGLLWDRRLLDTSW